MIYNPKGEEELKCTCERPDDFTCDYCDMIESKQILEKAKKRAEQMETIEEYSKKHSTTEEDMIYEASMKYLWRVADCKRTTGYADEDFREGYKAGMNLAQGYLNANLENFEKMKDLFDIKDVERIANHFYYKGIKKSSIPEVKFDFDEFIKTFKKQ
jgi:ribosome-binding protein aMBF1 (putative translation factor)